MFDPVIAHEELSDGHKKLVGLYQEVLLSEDEGTLEDDMWFPKAVKAVGEDAGVVISEVSARWPHGQVSEQQIRQHCSI